MKKSAFLLLLLTALSICGCISESLDSPNYGSKLHVEDSLPQFTVITTAQDTITSRKCAGRTTVLLFFHTECNDCRKELPVVEQVYRENRNDSLWQLVCIGREENADQVIRYWQTQGFTMPVSPQQDRQVYERFAYSGVPMLYVINAQGVIQAIFDDRNMATYDDLKGWILKVNEENQKARAQVSPIAVN